MTEPMHDNRLQEEFAALSKMAVPTDDCPPPDRLWAAVAGELAADEVREVVDHTASCGACAEAWRLAMHISEHVPSGQLSQAPQAKPVATATWWRTAAAMAAVFLGLAIFGPMGLPPWSQPDPPLPPAEYRDTDLGGITSETPEDAPLPRDAFLLSWRLKPAEAGARYQVRVSTALDLQLIAEARDLDEPRFQVPESALVDLEPETRLLWNVEVVLPDGGRRTSITFLAHLR